MIPEIAHTFQDWPDDTAKYGAHIVYLPGCSFHCYGCHNLPLKKYQNWSAFQLADALERLYNAMPVRHVILSGGDPFFYANEAGTEYIVTALGILTNYVFTVYTGTKQGSIPTWVSKKKNIQYIKCGQYIKKLQQKSGHRDGKFYLASTNQVLIDGKGAILSHGGVYNKGVANV
jgi:organic radical activating enzyme